MGGQKLFESELCLALTDFEMVYSSEIRAVLVIQENWVFFGCFRVSFGLLHRCDVLGEEAVLKQEQLFIGPDVRLNREQLLKLREPASKLATLNQCAQFSRHEQPHCRNATVMLFDGWLKKQNSHFFPVNVNNKRCSRARTEHMHSPFVCYSRHLVEEFVE